MLLDRLPLDVAHWLGGERALARAPLVLSLETQRVESAEAADLMVYLDDHEKRRASKLIEKRKFVSFVTAHAVLRLALARSLKVSAGHVCYDYAKGKPAIAASLGRGPQFSLSHSGEMLAVGFRVDGEIGVDVERVDTAHPLLRHIESLCSPTELSGAGMQHPDTRLRSMFRLWTRKEAYLKALGTGIDHHHLGKIRLSRTRRHSWRVDDPLNGEARAVVHDLGEWAGFCGAVCCIPGSRRMTSRRISLQGR